MLYNPNWTVLPSTLENAVSQSQLLFIPKNKNAEKRE
jgi:hypothetical protein